MHHAMSPTTVAALFLLAVTIDYLSIGPNSMRDRLAFLIALPTIREGFGGGPLDQWTVGALSSAIDALKHATGSSYIAGAATSGILSVGVSCLAIWAVACLLPDKTAKKLGSWASWKFPTTPMKRINFRLWGLAAALGLLADLPHGLVGGWLRAGIAALAHIVGILPGLLFGVA